MVIGFGAGKARWYTYLGQALPEVKVVRQDRKETSRAEAIQGNVGAVCIFAASNESRPR